eukprot:15467289-Alexandrium_andersonii.AAC.1
MDPAGRALPESMGPDDPRAHEAVRRAREGLRQNGDGVYVAKSAESEMPTFHHQDPRVEGEELFGQAVRNWLPKLMFGRPEEGWFQEDTALFGP